MVSDDSRSSDTFLSILMLGDSSKGRDVVEVDTYATGKRYVHCGMVTYVKRELLTEHVTNVDEETMHRIDMTLARELGIENDYAVQAHLYRKMYNELLDKLVNKIGDVSHEDFKKEE